MTRDNDRRGGPYKHLETDEEFVRRVFPGTGAGGRTGETLDNWMWECFRKQRRIVEVMT